MSDCIFSLTASPVHCCSTVFRSDVTDISYPFNTASKADIYLGVLLRVRKLAMLRDRYGGVVKSSTYRSATTKYTDKVIRQTNNLKLPKVLLFVGFNTTMALAILTEREFVGAGIVQSCGCETAQGDQYWDYVF